MKRPASLLLALALALPLAATESAGETRMSGMFSSSYQDRPKSVTAYFTPTGDEEWDVYFLFEFNGRDHRYEGTAHGSLADGELRGEVRDEGGRRTFTFEGETRKGKFRGNHAEVRRGREQSTGTLSLTAR